MSRVEHEPSLFQHIAEIPVRKKKQHLARYIAQNLSHYFGKDFDEDNIFFQNSFSELKGMARLATAENMAVLGKMVSDFSVTSTINDKTINPHIWIFSLLSTINDKKVRDWIRKSGDHIKRIDAWEIEEIFDEPSLYKFMEIPYHTLVNLLSCIPPTIKRKECIDFLLEKNDLWPQLIPALIGEGNNTPWDERFRRLKQLHSVLGTEWVDDDEMNTAIMGLVKPDDEGLADIPEHFHHYSPIQQQQVLNRLRNKFTPEENQWLRTTYHQIISPERKREMEIEWEDRLSAIKFTEHPLHPWAYYFPYFGYEIEAAEIPGIEPMFLKLLREIGWQFGDGGDDSPVEFSPGPFHSPLTVRESFLTFINSGWLDLYKANSQTYHSNTQVLDDGLRFEVDHMMVAAAYAYHPFQKPGGDYYHLLPEAKESDVTNDRYYESEGYAVLNKHDTLKHSDRYMALSAAVQAVLNFKSEMTVPTEKDEHFTSKKAAERKKKKNKRKIDIILETTLEEAYLFGVSKETLQLAQVWLRAQAAFSEMYSAVRKRATESRREPFGSLHLLPDDFLLQEILAIFPSVEDHVDETNLQKETWPATLELDGEELVFPNIVAASRYLVTRLMNEVFEIVSEVQEQVIVQVLAYKNATTKEKPQLMSSFFAAHPFYLKNEKLQAQYKKNKSTLQFEEYVMHQLVEFIDTTLPASWRKNMTQETDEH